ncbi:MAG: BatA domain-containing protein [Planctomycetia bacterium]|nr:BatA domain-containing protein [Planctomycetia bacterium]
MLSLLSPMAVLPFVTPWLFAAGAAAVSIPIAIHLLNRRRFRLQAWAAMEFLLAAHRRNMRKLKLQRWLLLLLRCLALLLLAAGIAQFLPPGSVLGAILGNAGRLTLVVWDNAYTTQYRPADGKTLFVRAQLLLTHWFHGASTQDRIAIISGSVDPHGLLHKPVADPAAVNHLVAGQKPTDAAVDLAAGLKRALMVLQKQKKRTGRQRLWLLTDGAQAAFAPLNSTGTANRTGTPQRLKTLMTRIRKTGAAVRVFEVGDSHAGSMAITQLKLVRHFALINHPARVRIAVFNATAMPQAQVQVRLFLDHVAAGTVTLPRLNAGSEVTVDATLSTDMTVAGMHTITARLPADGLLIDNTRRLVVRAHRRMRLLLVDGAPGNPLAHRLASTAWLATALAPLAHGNTFAPHVIRSLELSAQSLRHEAAVIFSDVPAPGPQSVARLRSFVDTGGLLLIFPGPNVNGRSWNAALGTGRHGLLPAVMGAMVQPAKALHFNIGGTDNAITEPFIAARQSGIHTGIGTVTLTRYLALRVIHPIECQTLLSLGHDQSVLVSRRVGRGKVVLAAFTCDTRWTDFPAQPSFLPFVYQLMYYGLPDRNARWNLISGGRFALPAGSVDTWYDPSGKAWALQNKQIGARMVLTSPRLWQVGLYHNATRSRLVAVNVDPADADIRHLSAARIATILGLPVTDVVSNPRNLSRTHAHKPSVGGNAGQRLLLLALLVLLAETLLARAFSRYDHGGGRGKKRESNQ